ncbi:MAG: hypothetical protein ACOC4G_09865 [Bacillota bacterium]
MAEEEIKDEELYNEDGEYGPEETNHDSEEKQEKFSDELAKELKNDTGIDYLLFLILILLLVGNQTTFNEYFNLFDQQTKKMKEVLDVFSATAEGFKSAVLAPQKMLNE